MNKGSTVLLQGVVVLIGLGALAFLLIEPHFEGRNASATPFQIYFHDPFLAYVYVGSVPFFVALYQAFRMLGFARQNKVFSPVAVSVLRTIKYCAVAVLGFVLLGECFLLMAPSDDRAGGVFMGILFSSAAIIVASAAAMLERILQAAVELKTEHDLTV